MKPKDTNLAAFFKAVKKSHNSSRGGTISAEKPSIMQSPSRPVQPMPVQQGDEMTPAELQRLKDAAARANATYDATRKAYKAQQKTKARVQGLTNSGAPNQLHALRTG